MVKFIEFLLFAYVFMVGSCLGSFINVVIYRLPNKISISKGFSHCTSCNERIRFYDLIPIFSFLFLKGKCRYCKEKISPRYIIVEIICGVLAVLSYSIFGFSFKALFTTLLLLILLAIAVIDIDTLTIPNELVISLLPLLAISFFLFPEVAIWSRVVGFFVVSVPIYLLCLVLPDAFGGGDIKLFAVLGGILGLNGILLTFFIAVLIGGIYAVFIVATKKVNKKSHICFAPYICVGASIAFMWGEVIIKSYLALFGL